MWANVIGDDKYAPERAEGAGEQAAEDAGNAYDDFKALLALARLQGETADPDRGTWKGRRPLKGVFPTPQMGFKGDFFGRGQSVDPLQQMIPDDIDSTSSEDSDSDLGEAPQKLKQAVRESLGDNNKRRREKKSKKEKKDKKEKKEKKKKEKKKKKKKRARSDSDSD